ncbi:DUF2345 domain-containing protein, partial [Pseudacidovorax intermedius]|uniref:DUF2345 domain-containing protein n=1 Tax=Pseudacidovorax intermedius TaxID=433924 RepID=UPI00128F7C3F
CVGGRGRASGAQGRRSFVRKGGLKWIASRGPVQVQAHQGEVVLVAHKDVRITSVEGRIRIQAKKKVVLIGGGSYTEWSAEGIRHGTAGSWQEHAAMHAQVGPMSRPVEGKDFARSEYQPGEKAARRFGPSK